MHVEKLPNGRGYRVYVHHRGRRRSATRRTRGDALHAGAELLLELGGGSAPTGVTVGEMVAGHLSDAAWSPTTLTDARRVVDRLPEAFMRRAVHDVTAAVLAGLYRQLARDGWTDHRIRRAHMVLSVSFADAVTYGWCPMNPCRDAKPPTGERPRVRSPQHSEVRSVLEQADPRLGLFLRIACCTGARRGELVALRWPDIDLDAGEVTIARSIVYTPADGLTERPTKTGAKSHRRLALDPGAVQALRLWRAEQSIAGMQPEQWVFSHDAGGSPWRPDFISRLFRLARDRAGVTGVRLHDVRHYVATTMLQDGEAAVDVAAQLGHASVATTLSVYAHYLPGRGRDSAERRAARLERDGSTAILPNP